MSVDILLSSNKRLGQAHYLQKIKKVEDELNSAFSHLCRVVADHGIIANISFSEDEKKFSVNVPLKRQIDTDGKDTTKDFVEEILIRKGVITSWDDVSILNTPIECQSNDLLQVSVLGDATEKITDDKISVSKVAKKAHLPIGGVEDWYTCAYKKPDQRIFESAGYVKEEDYLKEYYWIDQGTMNHLKTCLSEEVEVLDQVKKYQGWVKDPKDKNPRASNLFIELSELIQVFIDSLSMMTPGNQDQTVIRKVDGFLLYTEKVGFTHRYSDAIQDRTHTLEGMVKYFDLRSGVDDVKVGLPVVKKYSQYKDIEAFLAWLYSFWGSASNQSFAGRAAAILRSKPKSGSLGKSGSSPNRKPTGSKGKGKGKEASSKKTSSKDKKSKTGNKSGNQTSPKKGKGKAQIKNN